jgi:hypothetical protein
VTRRAAPRSRASHSWQRERRTGSGIMLQPLLLRLPLLQERVAILTPLPFRPANGHLTTPIRWEMARGVPESGTYVPIFGTHGANRLVHVSIACVHVCVCTSPSGGPAPYAAFLAGCRDSVSLPGDLKRHQAKFFCITRCVALKRTRATSPCAGPRHDLSSRARSARTDLAQISRRVRAVIF